MSNVRDGGRNSRLYTFFYYIKIEYLKNKKVEAIKLLWKTEDYETNSCDALKNRVNINYFADDIGYNLIKREYFADQYKTKSFLDLFITSLDATNKSKMGDMDYIFIRESNENDYITEITNKKDKNEMILNSICKFLVIIPMFLFFLISVLEIIVLLSRKQ